VNIKRGVLAVPVIVATSVLLMIQLLAWLLHPFRIGRLLQTVSIPRLREHRLRTSLTVFGIALGVATLVAVVIVNDSVARGVAATVDDLAGTTDLQVSAGTSGFAEQLLEQVRATPGVLKAVPVMQQTVTVRDPRAAREPILLLGVDMLDSDDDEFRRYGSSELRAIRDDPVAFLNSPYNILLSRSFARRYGYRLHDSVMLATALGVMRFDIWGFLDDAGVGRAFGGAIGVMYYQAMQVAFARGLNIDRVDIALPPGSDLGRVEARLQRQLGSGFVVERPARKGDRVGKMLMGLRSGLSVASLIALLVGAFLIHNTMAISVVQRKREIGILRALGSRRRELIALLTLEGALLGGVGSLLGIVLGIGLSRTLLAVTSQALNQTYLQLAATEVSIDGRMLAAALVLGTLAATVASAVPARRAARNRPAETLSTGNLTRPVPYPLRPTRNDLSALAAIAACPPLLALPPLGELPLGAFAAAFTLLLSAALLLPRLVQLMEWLLAPLAERWLGVETRLANGNLPRDLGRTTMTAGALMCGVSLAVAFGTFTHSFATTLNDWVVQTLPGDLFITQGARMGGSAMRNVPMADALYAELAHLPEVDTVRRVRIVEMPFRGFTLKAIASDTEAFLRHAHWILLEGELAEIAPALRAGAVMVSENFARHFHVHRGDRIALSTQDGTRTFRVVGVFVDYSSDVGSVMFDRPTYVAAFHDSRVDTYELHLHNPSDAQRVRRYVQARFGESHDLFVLTNREFRDGINDTTEQIFSLVRALELVALIVAVLGIINAQLANVLDRIREIGVLRALGMLRRQVSRMIVIEAVLVGVIGTLAGIGLGSAIGHVLLSHINLVQTGWYFPYRLSIRAIVEVSCLTVPAAALAGLYPARAASRLEVADALEYE
jgi:putative ABC transport system permease protein